MIYNTIRNKLNQSTSYTHKELDCLIDHIGDTNPDIRDQLVYASFCHAIGNQLLSRQELDYLTATITQQNLLFLEIGEHSDSTLTRSFTALLYALLLDADNNQNSNYYHILTDKDRNTLFNHALDYLIKEKDYRGYDSQKGWIHALAHGAEFLMAASAHELFPEDKRDLIWSLLVQVFK